MADNRIKRIIQLILDRTSAQKAEKETQESLRKGTDSKVPAQNLGRIEGAMGKLRLAAVAVGAAIVGSLAVGIRKLIRESTEAQNTTAQLEAVIASTGGAAGRTVELPVAIVRRNGAGARPPEDLAVVRLSDFLPRLRALLGVTDWREP